MEKNDNFRVIEKLKAELFAPEERRFCSVVNNLFAANKRLIKDHGDGFSFEGQTYRPENAPTWGKLQYTVLHDSLIPEIRTLIADKAKVVQDRQTMGQVFYQLLQACKTLQDIRDALPECLQDMFPELSKYERTRPEAYTLRGNDRAIRQYEKALPRMEFYSAVRFIY